MNKYKVEVFANVGNYEIIEAKNEAEAKEEMWNMIMDYPDFYIEIVAEECEDEGVEEDEK